MSWGMPEERTRRRLPNRIAVLLLSAFLVSSTYAINISINAGKGIEYGQGVYQIKACDQYIAVELKAATSVNGVSNVGNVIFKGLDINRCKGTALRLKLYQSGVSTPLELYGKMGDTGTVTSVSPIGNSVILMIVREIKTTDYCYTAFGADPTYDPDYVNIVSSAGVNKCYSETGVQSLGYAPSSGNFTVKFTYPLADMAKVNSVTLESASL